MDLDHARFWDLVSPRYRAKTSQGTFRKYFPDLGSRTDKALTPPKAPLWTSVIITVVPAFNFGPVKPS